MRSLEKQIVIAAAFAFGFVPTLVGTATAEPTGQASINWHSSLDAAGQLAAQSGRPVLIHFWRTDCRPCRNMERTIHTQPHVVSAIQSNFILVKINCKLPESAGTLSHYKIKSVPTEIIVAPDGQVLARIEAAPSSSTEYMAALQQGFNAPRANQPATMVAAGSHTPSVQVASQQHVQPHNVAMQPQNVTPPSPTVQRPQGENPYMVASARQESVAPVENHPVVPLQPIAPQNLPGQAVVDSSVPAGGVSPSETAGGESVAQSASRPSNPSPPIGFALDGYCPVILKEKEVWTQGDRRWGANHEGRVYLFAGAEHQQRFLKNPELYAPTLAGFDIVRLVDSGEWVSGWRGFGVFYNKRIFLFTGEESLACFEANPDFYVQSSEKIRQEIAQRQSTSAGR